MPSVESLRRPWIGIVFCCVEVEVGRGRKESRVEVEVAAFDELDFVRQTHPRQGQERDATC